MTTTNTPIILTAGVLKNALAGLTRVINRNPTLSVLNYVKVERREGGTPQPRRTLVPSCMTAIWVPSLILT